jgi:hypothetical protein
MTEIGEINVEEPVGSEVKDASAGLDDQLKQEYLKYIQEIKDGRFEATTADDAIKHITALSKVLSLTTVVPKIERRASKGEDGRPQSQDIIVGGTSIDLVKSQYPGVYPILMERLLELATKL